MKVAYITVATGNYKIFIDGLVESGIKNFFTNCETDFIILTDSQEHLSKKLPNTKFIEQSRLGFPYDTLKRYHLINSIKTQLDYDYLFFGNVNMIFNQPITEDILATNNNSLIGVTHPGFYGSSNRDYTYERNPNSTACVAFGEEGDVYYQGCFFGGNKADFLKMSEELQRRVDIDLERGIIAVWWDESHMNKYFLENSPNTLDPGYAYADAYNLPQFTRMITQLDKRNYGSHYALRYT
jgi:hypothetical protein